MTLPENLDSINLIILRVIATGEPNTTTREIEAVVYLSRRQVLRRLRVLRERGLIVRRNSVPGQTYRYELGPDITSAEIEEANVERLNINPDPVAREALSVLLQGMQAISASLVGMTKQIESMTRQIENILR